MSDFESSTINGHTKYFYPIDEETGLPLCLFPRTDVAPAKHSGISSLTSSQVYKADYDHLFGKSYVRYMAQSGKTFMTEADAITLSGSRGQWVNFEQHHYEKNPCFTGPHLPPTLAALGRTIIMAEAGYIPESAVDFAHDGQPVLRGLTGKQRQELWTQGIVRVMDPGIVKTWLREFVLSVDVSELNINSLLLEELFYTFNQQRRIEIGQELAGYMVERAVEPAEAEYQAARRKGLLTYVNINGRWQYTPARAAELVVKRLQVGSHHGSLHAQLYDKLADLPRRPRDQWKTEAALA